MSLCDFCSNILPTLLCSIQKPSIESRKPQNSEEKEGEDVMIVTKHNPEQAFKFLMAKVVEWCEKHPTPIAKLPGQDFWIT
jgi:hypothetical protein